MFHYPYPINWRVFVPCAIVMTVIVVLANMEQRPPPPPKPPITLTVCADDHCVDLRAFVSRKPMSTKKPLPTMPSVFIPSHLPEMLEGRFAEQLQQASKAYQAQTAKVVTYFLKEHGVLHEQAIVMAILSSFVSLFNAILEPSDDPAIVALRLGAFERIKLGLETQAPEVLENMVKFYQSITDITLRDKDPEDDTGISDPVQGPSANAPNDQQVPDPAPVPRRVTTDPSKWLN